MEDEVDDRIKKTWELFLDIELGHLQIAADLFKKYEKRDPEEVIGSEIVIPCRFMSQKDYVQKVLEKEANKRLGMDKDYTTTDKLPEDWPSYKVQEKQNEISSPSENSIRLVGIYNNRDIIAADKELAEKEVDILKKGLQKKAVADNTVMPDELEDMIQKYEKMKDKLEELI